jgi:hypothetical protein
LNGMKVPLACVTIWKAWHAKLVGVGWCGRRDQIRIDFGAEGLTDVSDLKSHM